MRKAPSPNFNDRAKDTEINFLILHYTGMRSAEEALQRMTNPATEVSAHYMIDTDGTLFQLVDEKHRAWHAGKSSWQNITDINTHSIGIELVNLGHEFGYHSFPIAQIKTLEKLSQEILARHPILPHHILGHSDIAPDRKEDPGELFDWKDLAQKGIGFFPTEAEEKNTVIENLNIFGYNTTHELDVLITAFQRHFRPEKIDGTADNETRRLLQNCADHVSASCKKS
ncbi:MAG: N-acetylmuramoyl-L-alanine amidase [Alphaproteobacteria bacterium]